MTAVRCAAAVTVLLFAAILQPPLAGQAGAAPAPPGNVVGMVTLVSGEVVANSGAASATPARPFMKIRADDRFRLAAGARLQLLFFSGGRKETWHGPVEVRLLAERGRAVGNDGEGGRVRASDLPPEVAGEVMRLMVLLAPGGDLPAGSGPVRGNHQENGYENAPVDLDAADRARIASARTVYRKMQLDAAPGDLTAELYLFSVLADFDQYEEMAGLIEVMRGKQPENRSIDRLSEWLRNQM